jgi:murein DD-endopeptidase MepM/ murein hydrolase activator NlpD
MRWSVGAVFLLLAACAVPANADPEQQATAPATPPLTIQPVPGDVTPFPTPQAIEIRRAVPPPITCAGPATQGGAILCQTSAGAIVSLDGNPVAVADGAGVALIGLKRSQGPLAIVSLAEQRDVSPDERSFNAVVEVKPRSDTVSQFEMECRRISPQSPEDQRKAEVSWVKKDNALKVFSEPLAPISLASPVAGDFPLTSSFGATRTYVPKTKDCESSTSVHNGTDIAVPTGTEIRAPMAGTVILADPDLFYEGGCIFLDLGRGLVSVTMHMSRVDVKAGDKVEQGQLLGLSGATGRVTGPHLHWGIKYRNVLSSDRGADIWLDPVLMLQLQPLMVPAP